MSSRAEERQRERDSSDAKIIPQRIRATFLLRPLANWNSMLDRLTIIVWGTVERFQYLGVSNFHEDNILLELRLTRYLLVGLERFVRLISGVTTMRVENRRGIGTGIILCRDFPEIRAINILNIVLYGFAFLPWKYKITSGKNAILSFLQTFHSDFAPSFSTLFDGSSTLGDGSLSFGNITSLLILSYPGIPFFFKYSW